MTNLTDTGKTGVGLDEPDMSGIEDIVDAMDLCDEHEVPYDGLEDIEEFIERLRLHFIKQKFTDSRKKQVHFNFGFGFRAIGVSVVISVRQHCLLEFCKERRTILISVS